MPSMIRGLAVHSPVIESFTSPVVRYPSPKRRTGEYSTLGLGIFSCIYYNILYI
jgi:hypothetical protein